MTASPGREVDPNLLRGAAPGSAQTGANAQDAGGEDLSDLVEALGRGHEVGVERLAHARDEMLASKRLLEAKIVPPGDKLQQKRSPIKYQLHKQ
jgi:hypothetical protein